MELLCSSATDVQAARREFRATSRQLEVHKAKVGELELIVQLQTDAAERTADLQRKLSVKKAELACTKSVLDTKKAALKAKVRRCEQLNNDLVSARAVVSRGERVIRDFDERVGTGYTSSMRAQMGSYRHSLKALLTVA